MSMGSVILLVKSKYKLWFKDLMKEYVHYIPIKEDLSDIDEKLEWCVEHDQECKVIGKNSIQFFNMYLQEDNIYNYLENVINKIDCNDIYPVYDKLDNSHLLSDNSNISCNIQNLKLSRQYSYQKAFSEYMKNFSLEDFIKLEQKKNIVIHTNNNYSFIEKQNYSIIESLIGINYINHLYFRIPNFMYTYKCTKTSLYLEHIQGIEFQNWLKISFNLQEYINILVQIILALYVAQEYCNFRHSDLSPWNIILYEYPEEIEVYYQIKKTNKFIKIKTKTVPVIIDYGKSTTNKIKQNSFCNFNFTFDLLSIVIRSINTILINNINDNEFYSLILILKFFEDIFPKFTNIFSFRKFIKHRSKYDNLINFCNNKSIDNTLDFFYYLTKNFSIHFEIINNYKNYNTNYYKFIYYKIINKTFSFKNLNTIFPSGKNYINSVYLYTNIFKIFYNNNVPEILLDKLHKFYLFIQYDKLSTKNFDTNKLYDILTSPILSTAMKEQIVCD